MERGWGVCTWVGGGGRGGHVRPSPIAMFELVWFMHRAVGLRVVFGLAYKLLILAYLVSLVVEPLGLMSLLLVLVCLILAVFELFKLVSLVFSFVFTFPVHSSSVSITYQFLEPLYSISLVFGRLRLVCLVDVLICIVCVVLAVGVVVVLGWVRDVVVVVVVGFGRFGFPVVMLCVIRVRFVPVVAVVAVVTIVDVLVCVDVVVWILVVISHVSGCVVTGRVVFVAGVVGSGVNEFSRI